MNLLLDTHIWLWSVGNPKRLTARVARELASPSNQLWLSPVSVWELLLLHRKRRIELDEEVGSWVRKTLGALQLNEAPLTFDVALEVSALNLPHGDPADHFLVASARVFGLTLVTADRPLIEESGKSGVSVLANQ
jgi:PIN domain nuclease of toxin-antitoxin system